MSAKTFTEIKKFNPYHGPDGRFTTGASATSFTIRTKDPNKQPMADKAKVKEQFRVRMQAIHSVEDRIRKQDFESAALIDKNGNQVFFKDGESHCVAFSAEETKSMKGNTLTHNHPGGGILSCEDVGTMVGADLNEIRATTASGKTFSIKRTEGYTDDKGLSFYTDYRMEYGKAIERAESDLDAKGYREKIMSGVVSQAQADKEMNELITNYMSDWLKKNDSKYSVEFSAEDRAA